MKKFFLSFLFLALLLPAPAEDVKTRKEVSDYLQNISVTIRAEDDYQKSEGSGVLITREIEGKKITFVWTAGHVVNNLREVRNIIVDGSSKKIVEFGDVQIIKELVEGGRRVGEIQMDATVIKFSDATDGQDLALLMVRAKDYGKDNANFYLSHEEPIIPIGSRLFHVGSLLGQMGSNSMTSGIVSQVGRTHGKMEFDQTTVTAFPGSSGGGVYLQDGRYVGMLVRGAGENFNLMVPIRRIKKWAKEHDLLWAIDPSQKLPTFKEIREIPVEDSGFRGGPSKEGGTKEMRRLPYLLRVTSTD
jgi:S1-C subfamily serine protease